jgi:putative oxidoreductase
MDDQSKSRDAGIFARCYGMFVKAAECLQSPLLLGMRLYWGWQFFLSGKGKLTSLDKVSGFFQTLHIPFPHLNAVVVAISEGGGGLLLMLGFGTRAVAALLAFDMIVAYLTADRDSVKNIWNDSDKFVSAAPFLFLLACVILVAFGPGRLSLDGQIKKLRASGQEKVS